MYKNYKKLLFILGVTTNVAFLFAVIIFSFFVKYDNYDVINSISTCCIGLILPFLISKIIELNDSLPWETYLRRMKRSKEITNKTYIRNSYAFGFVLQVDGKYLLIKNNHGFDQYGIPSSTYSMNSDEKRYLKENFNVKDDDRITTNRIVDDYRMFVQARFIKNYFKRFVKISSNFNRSYFEFAFNYLFFESNIFNKDDFGIPDFKFSKRVVRRINWSRYFSTYELIIYDVFEVNLSKIQQEYILSLDFDNKGIRLASEQEIEQMGINKDKGITKSWILPNACYIFDNSSENKYFNFVTYENPFKQIVSNNLDT